MNINDFIKQDELEELINVAFEQAEHGNADMMRLIFEFALEKPEPKSTYGNPLLMSTKDSNEHVEDILADEDDDDDEDDDERDDCIDAICSRTSYEKE